MPYLRDCIRRRLQVSNSYDPYILRKVCMPVTKMELKVPSMLQAILVQPMEASLGILCKGFLKH